MSVSLSGIHTRFESRSSSNSDVNQSQGSRKSRGASSSSTTDKPPMKLNPQLTDTISKNVDLSAEGRVRSLSRARHSVGSGATTATPSETSEARSSSASLPKHVTESKDSRLNVKDSHGEPHHTSKFRTSSSSSSSSSSAAKPQVKSSTSTRSRSSSEKEKPSSSSASKSREKSTTSTRSSGSSREKGKSSSSSSGNTLHSSSSQRASSSSSASKPREKSTTSTRSSGSSREKEKSSSSSSDKSKRSSSSHRKTEAERERIKDGKSQASGTLGERDQDQQRERERRRREKGKETEKEKEKEKEREKTSKEKPKERSKSNSSTRKSNGLSDVGKEKQSNLRAEKSLASTSSKSSASSAQKAQAAKNKRGSDAPAHTKPKSRSSGKPKPASTKDICMLKKMERPSEVNRVIQNTPLSAKTRVAALAKYLTARYKPIRQENPLEGELLMFSIIVRWVAANIAYDVKSLREGFSGDICEPEAVLKRGMSVCSGYSSLFKELCDAAELDCRSVSGWAKGGGYTIGQSFEGKDTTHAWNIIRIRNKLYLLDSTWASGSVNGDTFSRRWAPQYWLTPPQQFILDHLPENESDQLLASPVSMRDFERTAKPYGGQFEFILHEPRTAKLPVNKPIRFRIEVPIEEEAVSIAVVIDSNWHQLEPASEKGVYVQKIVIPKAGEFTVFGKRGGSSGSCDGMVKYIAN